MKYEMSLPRLKGVAHRRAAPRLEQPEVSPDAHNLY